MKITKILTILSLATLTLNSCQDEKTDQSIVDSIVQTAELQGERIPGNYIVMFKESKMSTTDQELSKIQFSTRLEKSIAYESKQRESKVKIDEMLSKSNLDLSKVSNYFTTQFAGVSLTNISVEELKMISRNPNVKAIYFDQLIPNPIDSVIESQNPFVNKAAGQVTPCGITNAGGFGNGAASAAWIWIIDTGVNTTHPDLNVIVDSRYAKSYIGTSVEDCNGHGTHVAGTAAAKNNGIGVVGVSAGAAVVPVRVFGCTGGASSSNILAAINHIGANDKPGDVVNMSLGGFFGANCDANSPYSTALRGLGNSGTRVALAAGNDAADATTFSPACTNGTNIFTVASMTCGKSFSSFSNYNRSAVDVIATGSDVYSTWLNGGYNTISGTSMASPHVAGIMHSRNNTPATNGSVSSRGQSYPIAVR